MYQNQYNFIEKSIKKLSLENSLKFVCDYLQKNINGYDWVGFYFHSKDKLVLKTYSGLKTDHTIIPFGKGICGQTAESNQPIIVKDVNEEDNYLSCNINVKSEIVVPILVNDKNIGQIDIDSNIIDRFNNDDLNFLKKINSLISKKI
ncbi:MAG: GAF domain-containing protein [Bacteroidota bacterium]|jgi:L-methionine (R)-S-oxide reductase